ncbi:hypothetical protein PHYSODRAFT_320081 [Phytophthora sojae]|uniref:Uncharacterized protein n=1 Tax=Phytophthora sojae (strain P6497) TaxID=1094619 RepID=G5AGD5_PHYSP|nr:hypothetical protein PHYSODRAFT_320081 [Phytophthora sojae]EGZ05375.1 hypothetical protein PHYSODRAFT_320081 [Phytophthora sojae]|eukprot:XP_009538906.1 hypothetical protein PHYSODRAFT_320081 [Phytophthora sojae]
MHVVAYKSAPPPANPPRVVSLSPSLGGCTSPSPFVDDDDGVHRPAWLATLVFLLPGQRRVDVSSTLREHVDMPYWIPYWRLTQPAHGLSDELSARPLLAVFRFVRFVRFYVASAYCDTKFVLKTSDDYLWGQVLSYERSSAISLVDDGDVLLEPGSPYVCIVAVRDYENDRCDPAG